MPEGRTLGEGVIPPPPVSRGSDGMDSQASDRFSIGVISKPVTAAFQTCQGILDEHRTILWISFTYILAGGVVQLILQRPWPLELTNRSLVYAWLALSIPWLAWQWVRHPKRLAACLSPFRLCGALLILCLALPIQITFQSLKQSIGPSMGFSWDPWLSVIDRGLHGGPAWHWFAWIVYNGDALAVIDTIYRLWFVLLLGFILWASWSKHRVLRSRAILAFLLLWILGGTIAAWIMASAGPCYYHRVATPDRAYVDLVTAIRSHGPLWATFSQDWLWTLYTNDGWQHFGGISAFPSMHVGLAVLLALVAWHVHRGVGAILWLFAVLTQIGSVVLAWHYAIDGYAGALIAWACWLVAGRITVSEEARRQGPVRVPRHV